MAGFDPLRAYLESKAPFTATELDFLEGLFIPTTLPPVSSCNALANRCGMRHLWPRLSSQLRRRCRWGRVILEFAPENWWIGDRTFLTGGATCECFIDSIGHSDLLLFEQRSHQKMVECVPTFAAMFRLAFQKYAARRTAESSTR